MGSPIGGDIRRIDLRWRVVLPPIEDATPFESLRQPAGRQEAARGAAPGCSAAASGGRRLTGVEFWVRSVWRSDAALCISVDAVPVAIWHA